MSASSTGHARPASERDHNPRRGGDATWRGSAPPRIVPRHEFLTPDGVRLPAFPAENIDPVGTGRRGVPVRLRAARPPLVAAIALAAACGTTAPGASSDGLGLRHAYWRAGDRVLVSDFRDVGAVAADRRFVFAASEQGVLVFDHRFQGWLAPLTVEDGFPRADLPVALEVDPLSGTLWMVTRSGALWAHDVALGGEWRWVGSLPGTPPARLVPHEGSLWIRTGSGWFESSGGGAPTRANPPAEVQGASGSGLEQLERSSAAFRSTGSSLTVDEFLRRYEITSAAPSPNPSVWWLGTWGGGLYSYDDRMLDAEPMRYGAVGRGVAAIGVVPGDGGYWFGSDGLDMRRGVAHADRDLQRWLWHEGGREGAPGSPVHAILETEAGLFVGAQDGLYRLAGDRWERATDADGLPAPTVRALAASGGALWAGTDRGLARIQPQGRGFGVERVDGTTGARIHALATLDSLLWIASERGLWSLNLRTGTLAQPPLDDARLRGRVLGVAHDAGTLYALAESTLLAYDGASWTAPLVTASLAGIGRPTHLAARAGVVWIAGTAGALGFDPITGAETLFSVPRDIPEGPVRQVVPVAGGVWFATPAGALLIRFE